VKRASRARKWISRNPRPVRYVLLGCGIASLLAGAVLVYYYASFARIIDARRSNVSEYQFNDSPRRLFIG